MGGGIHAPAQVLQGIHALHPNWIICLRMDARETKPPAWIPGAIEKTNISRWFYNGKRRTY